jgi:tripartite-type tricarboxylate transporter receptor subunit TctC
MSTAHRLLVLVLLAACVRHGSAQTYPSKPIHIIVPLAAGGPTDVQARWAGQQLNAALGQPVIVENRAAAGGVPGTDAVAKSAPDGYTLVAGNPGPLTIAPTVVANLPYDTLRDFAPIFLIAKSASCLCINPGVPARDLQEFIAFAKSRPGKINFGTPGIGTVGHLAIELFSSMAGIRMNHVPYKGAAQFTVDLLNGNLEIAQVQFAQSIPLIKAGKLRALGVTSRARQALLPEVPTIAEQGLKDFESTNWNGVLAPAGTPREVLLKIRDVLARALATPEARDLFVGQGHELGGLALEEYGAFIRAEIDKWAQVAKSAGIPKM